MSEKRENIWLNLCFNIVAPSVLLIKGKRILELCGVESWDSANVWIFVVSLAFPTLYGLWDLSRRRKWNIISAIGILSVLLTGGVGLFKLSKEVMIIKEGTVPLVIGAAVLATAPTRRPLAKMLIMNESVMDVKKIESALDERGTREEFDSALKGATYVVALSFVLSSVLNFALASWIFKSPAGTEEFNAEVGRMTALSFPVIALPATIIMFFAVYKIFGAITRCTGLKIEEIVSGGGK